MGCTTGWLRLAGLELRGILCCADTLLDSSVDTSEFLESSAGSMLTGSNPAPEALLWRQDGLTPSLLRLASAQVVPESRRVARRCDLGRRPPGRGSAAVHGAAPREPRVGAGPEILVLLVVSSIYGVGGYVGSLGRSV